MSVPAPTAASAFLPVTPLLPSTRTYTSARVCACAQRDPTPSQPSVRRFGEAAAVAVAAAALVGSLGAEAALRLPPIDTTNTTRCVPSSSNIGQANAARDSLLDLRDCDLRKYDLSNYDLSGGLLAGANLDGVKLVNSQLSKAYASDAQFRGADFTNAVVDRVTFNGADLAGAVFANAVLSDSTFDDANLEVCLQDLLLSCGLA